MYPNLRAEIARLNLTYGEVAKGIGRSESQFSMKMSGKTGWTLADAFEVKKFLKTKLPIDVLFRCSGDMK